LLVFKDKALEELKQIIVGCINKDRKYQQMFYSRYNGFACRVVFRYIYRYENAMDVVTDGFVKAFSHFQDFKMPDDDCLEKLTMGWLKKIMINCSIDQLRKQNMLPEIGRIDDQVWELSDHSSDADKQLLYSELIQITKELPPHYRVVFNLYVIDGYSHIQIAERLNISVGTSKSNLSRARALLQKRIKNLENAKSCTN
jgi:RNA polymerase sigma factor (sigma-70 family)